MPEEVVLDANSLEFGVLGNADSMCEIGNPFLWGTSVDNFLHKNASFFTIQAISYPKNLLKTPYFGIFV